MIGTEGIKSRKMEIRPIINDILKGNPSLNSVNELIFICRKIALVHLRRKAVTGRLHPDICTIPLDDLATDCIADLFQQDDDGNMVQLKSYFEGLSLENISDEVILTHLRRLICGRVNQSIFRIYNEMDPSLGKILRNMKLAIQALHNFEIIDRFGDNCIIPSKCETLEHLPVLDHDDLERQLRRTANGSESVPELMAILSRYLREQTYSSRIVSLMTVALIFRSIYSNQIDRNAGETYIEDQFIVGDTSSIIHEVCRRMRSETETKYIKKKNVNPETFKKYFDVIEENLCQTIINKDGERSSFYESLKSMMPGLTKEEYRKRHKSKIEYLARLTHKRAIRELKKNM
jgi:hypothetical protein